MNKLLIFVVILIILYCSCISYEKFTNTKKNIEEIFINNEKYFMVAFSQFNDQIKDILIKNNLTIFTSIFDNQLSAIIKLINYKKDFIPINDPVLLIKYDNLNLLTNNQAHIIFDNKGNPLYNSKNSNINENRKLVVKNNIIMLVSKDDNINSSINFNSSKINDNFINAQKLNLNDNIKIFLGKTGTKNETIVF